jgi:signal transduction histidine kinase
MTSLPMPRCWPERVTLAPNSGASVSDIGHPGAELKSEIRHHEELRRDESGEDRSQERSPDRSEDRSEDEQFLVHAFRSFSEAAGSLEQSYQTLRAEVERLRSELEETQSKLRREQALAEVSSLLAHEIRNPLGSLELFAGLLAESDLDAEAHSWVEHVQAGLRTLAATVNNVLHFHSLPEPERAPVDLGQLLRWACDFFLPLARQSRITLSLQNRVSGVWLAADRHRLEQVLLNLVLNAIRAMPGGGWIEIGGRPTQRGEVVLSVSDTGPGISPEHLPSIFEPGFSTRDGSPGLGLAVCRKIVQQHGGTIVAESRSGCGATFTLVFPLTDKPLTDQPLAGKTHEGVTE